MAQPIADSLDKVAHAFAQAFLDKDVDHIVSFFAEDVIAMYPGWPLPTIGRAANRDVWITYYNSRNTHPFSSDTVITAASNDLGYSLGLWSTAEKSEPGAFSGRYIAVWRKKNGQWQIVVLSGHVHEDVHPFAV